MQGLFVLLSPSIYLHHIYCQQLLIDSTRMDAAKRVALNFDRNVNTYAWDMNGGYQVRGNDWQIDLTDRFQRSLIRTDRTLVKDENRFSLQATKSLSSQWTIASTVNSFTFSDQRTIALNSLASHTFLGGVRWNPFNELLVTPLAGYKIDNQLGVQDNGFAFSGSAELRPLQFGKYIAAGGLSFSAEYLNPRHLEGRNALAQFRAIFSEEGENKTDLNYRKLHRDFYLPYDSSIMQQYGVSHPIETRDEEQVGVGNYLRYRIAPPLAFHLTVEASQRTIDKIQKYKNVGTPLPVFDSQIEEFLLTGTASLFYNQEEKTKIDLRIGLNERDENHSISRFEGVDPVAFSRQENIEEQKNNVIRQTQIAFALSHAFSSLDTLSFTGSTLKLVYDTPSVTNVDDRDEIFFLIKVGWIHRFSPRFFGQVILDANLRHTVYISGLRSANNVWNRVFRFFTSTDYAQPSFIHSKNTAEVVANYSVYDFESVIQSVQSFSLRQMTLNDSSSIKLWKDVWLTGILQLRLYERGELRWSAFTLRPLNFFDERSLAVSLSIEKGFVRCAPGFRFFQQTRYNYSGFEKKIESEIRSLGPTFRAEVFLRNGGRVFIDGWYQITRETSLERRRVPNVTMNLSWNL